MQDTFAGGGNGIYVAIDCMQVIDNYAIVSGYINHGSNSNGDDITGLYAVKLFEIMILLEMTQMIKFSF